MRGIFRTLAIAGIFAATNAWADSEIVIAIRYLQAEGTSHSHLYLYREDGKLLRQLTKDNSGQDSGHQRNILPRQFDGLHRTTKF
jgi:hypothetical protein